MSLILMTTGVAGASAAVAQPSPDAAHGRYSFSPIADGVLRLDTRTGSVTNCTRRGSDWACLAVPDERAALDAEIGRLQAENQKLKEAVAARDRVAAANPNQPDRPKTTDSTPADPKAGGPTASDPRADGSNRIELRLPDDRDIDRAVAFVQRAWQRLIELADRVQRDVSGRI
jgi:hypothetical protein